MSSVLQWLFRILVVMFLIGIVGSLVVVCITTVEDFLVLFEKDAPAQGLNAKVEANAPPATQQQPAAQ